MAVISTQINLNPHVLHPHHAPHSILITNSPSTQNINDLPRPQTSPHSTHKCTVLHRRQFHRLHRINRHTRIILLVRRHPTHIMFHDDPDLGPGLLLHLGDLLGDIDDGLWLWGGGFVELHFLWGGVDVVGGGEDVVVVRGLTFEGLLFDDLPSVVSFLGFVFAG